MLARLRFFLRKIAAWFFIFLQPKVSIGKCKKLPDLVDFQGFVCYNILNIFICNVLNSLNVNKRRKAPYFS